MKALVLADVCKETLLADFPTIDFTFDGYAKDYNMLTREELAKIIPDYDILISEFDTIDKYIIDLADKLKMLICCRGGIHSVVDVPYAMTKNIIIHNTPGRNALAVAEYVIGMIIVLDRYLFTSNDKIQNNELDIDSFLLPSGYKDSLWGMNAISPYHIFRGKGLRGLRLGVIGYGQVGKEVVNIANKLGMKVIVNEHHLGTCALPPGVDTVTLDELLSNSDIVSVHCDNPDHRVMFDKVTFRKMKKTAYFINTARGDLVNESDLLEALNEKFIAGAAIDVTTHEPLHYDDPLLEAKNLIITPHIAGATDETVNVVTDMVEGYLREFIHNYRVDKT